MLSRAIFVMVAMFAALTAYVMYDGIRWQEFAEIHECQQIAKTDGYTIMQSGWNPVTKQWTMNPVNYPGHSVYKCNDGKEYTR